VKWRRVFDVFGHRTGILEREFATAESVSFLSQANLRRGKASYA
jgi:hypothetical protein